MAGPLAPERTAPLAKRHGDAVSIRQHFVQRRERRMPLLVGVNQMIGRPGNAVFEVDMAHVAAEVGPGLGKRFAGRFLGVVGVL